MMQVIRDGAIASREIIDNYSTLLEISEQNMRKREM